MNDIVNYYFVEMTQPEALKTGNLCSIYEFYLYLRRLLHL